MKQSLILFSSFCAFALITKSEAKLSIECLVDFLKFRNVNDDAFQSIESFSGDSTQCSNEVKQKIETFYSNARSKVEGNIRQKPYLNCIMKEIEGESYENVLLKAVVIDMKGVGLKFWKISQKNSRIKDLESKAQDIFDGAVIKCKGYDDYSAFFTAFYEQKRGEQFNDDFDYCLRKHLVDRQVINPNQYNFKMNPNNIQLDSTKCDNIMKTAMEQLKTQISGAGSKQCVIEKFIQNGYIDLILKIQLLTKLNLTPAERETEKQIFVTQMINMTHLIKSCPM